VISKLYKATALFLCLALLTGCTPSPTTTSSSGTTTSGEIRLQWWGVFWDQSVVASLITEYETANPGVKVSYVNKWTGGASPVATNLYEDELQRVLRNANPAEIPDIFMVPNGSATNYTTYASAAPTSVIDASAVATAFYPAVTADFVESGQVWGLPFWMDTVAILYHQDLITPNQYSYTTPPTNWNDFKNLAVNITQRSGNEITRAGFAAGTGSNVDFSAEVLFLLMLQNGVRMTDSSGTPIFANSELATTALSFYKSFSQANGPWAATLDNDSLAFLNKKAAMIAVPSWRYRDILYFNDTYNLNLNIAVAPMPQLLGQPEPTMNWATYWGAMVANNRPYATESWKFIDWLSQPDQLRKLYANDELNRQFFGFLYPRIDMQQDLQRNQYLRTYNAALSTAKTWRMVDSARVIELFRDLLDESTPGASQLSGVQTQVQGIVNNSGRF
jgi:multiple sugar transport system substrate-binding protein